MKKIILLFLAFGSMISFAQTNVYFKITHKLGSQPFAFNQAATNNLGNIFNVSRLEYYISGIELVHDGGQITPVTNTYILANASATTNELLGSFNITTLEAVRFAIGVDAATNHLDPAQYPASHPLAPKSPSMHWGWAGGYRFVAMEGKGGSSLTFTYEIHALDDVNYFTQTIPTAGMSNGNDLTISLNADYEQALKEINVSSGLVVHSSIGGAKTLLQNFSWSVFSSSEGNAAMNVSEPLQTSTRITVAPNPASRNQLVYIDNLPENAKVYLTDMTGRQHKVELNNQHISVANLAPGIYILRIMAQDANVAIERLIVN